MARDRTVSSTTTAVTTTSYEIPRQSGDNTSTSRAAKVRCLDNYLSAWSVRETTGSATALVKIRDSLALPGPIGSAPDGAAGNSTAGLHMYLITAVTRHGETTYGRNAGDRLEATTAGSKKVELAGIPLIGSSPLGNRQAIGTGIVGRRVYATKAGAPATGVTPTRAQWFLTVADNSTTLAAGMNSLSLPQASITVGSTTGFASAGNILVTTADGTELVSYTSVDATHFLGCTGGTGTMATGGAVTQPMLGDNTTTTYSLNVADGSFTATNPPLADTAGPAVVEVSLGASQSVGDSYGNNVTAAINDGGFAVEVTSGTVTWRLRGQ